MELNHYQLDVLKSRYLLPSETSWRDLALRVSTHVSKAENEKDQEYWKREFFNYIDKGYFIPAGRTLYGSGRKIGSLLNCFCLGIEDSRHSIAKFLHDMYLISTGGGGIGYDVSDIRPRGEAIQNIMGIAPGVVSEIKKVDIIGEQVTAGGGRRCALLASLSIYHPDIIEFLSAKMNRKIIVHHNISVVIDNNFLKMVRKSRPMKFEYKNKEYFAFEVKTNIDTYVIMTKDKDTVKTIYENQYKKSFDETIESIKKKEISAKELWDMIIRNAVECGEPGIQNIDLIQRNFAPKYFEKYSSTNPCLIGYTKVITDSYGIMNLDELINIVKTGEPVRVLSFNKENQMNEFKLVTWGDFTKKSKTLTLRIEEKEFVTEITCTPEHQIWTTNRGYVEAKDLTSEDDIKIL